MTAFTAYYSLGQLMTACIWQAMTADDSLPKTDDLTADDSLLMGGQMQPTLKIKAKEVSLHNAS